MTPAEAKREYHRRYREKNRERIREVRRKWVAENPEAVQKHYDKFYKKMAEKYENEVI